MAQQVIRKTENVPCRECHGKGGLSRVVSPASTQEVTCRSCSGRGRILFDVCGDCHGDGKVKERVEAQVVNSTCTQCGGRGYLVQVVELTQGVVAVQCSACGGAGGQFDVPRDRSVPSPYVKCGVCKGTGKVLTPGIQKRVIQPPSRLDGD